MYNVGFQVTDFSETKEKISEIMHKSEFKKFLKDNNSKYIKKSEIKPSESVLYDFSEILNEDKYKTDIYYKEMVDESEKSSDKIVVSYFTCDTFENDLMLYTIESYNNTNYLLCIGVTSMDGTKDLFEIVR